MTPHRKKCPHVVHFNVPRDWFEINSRHQKHYSDDGKKFHGCHGLLGRVIRTGVTRSCSALSNYTIPVHVHVFNNKGLMFS